MAVDPGRSASGLLFVIGFVGLGAEVVFSTYAAANGLLGSRDDLVDLLLAKSATLAVIYGLVFAVAILLRRPRWRDLLSGRTPAGRLRRVLSARFPIIAAASAVFEGILISYWFASGLFSLFFTVQMALGLLPFYGLLVAAILLRPPPDAGVAA